MDKKTVEKKVAGLISGSKIQEMMMNSGYEYLRVWVENMNVFFGRDYLKDFGRFVANIDQEWQDHQLDLLDQHKQNLFEKNDNNIAEKDFENIVGDSELVSFFKLSLVELFFSEYFDESFTSQRIKEKEAIRNDLDRHCSLVDSNEDEVITTNYPVNLKLCQKLYNQIATEIFESYKFTNTKRRGFNVKSGKVIGDIYVTAEVYSKGTISSLSGSIEPILNNIKFRLTFDTRCIHYGSKIPNYQNILYDSAGLFAGKLYEKFNTKRTFELATRVALEELCLAAKLIKSELNLLE